MSGSKKREGIAASAADRLTRRQSSGTMPAMPPKRSSAPPSQHESPDAALEKLSQDVRELTANVRTLTNAIDDLRAELEWATRNRGESAAPFRVTSFPLDPAAEDFHDRVNAASAKDIAAAEQPSPPPPLQPEPKTTQPPPKGPTAKPPPGQLF